MANPVVIAAMKNPEFLVFLVQSLSLIIQKEPTNENVKILQSICIVLLSNLKKHSKDFFSIEQVNYAYVTLFQILFMLNTSNRHYIINIFEILFCYFKMINYEDAVKQCFLILEKNENINNMSTALNLIYLYLKNMSKVNQNEIFFNQISVCILPIINGFVKQSLVYLTSISEGVIQSLQHLDSPQFSQLDPNEIQKVKETAFLIERNFVLILFSSKILIEILISKEIQTMVELKEIIANLSSILRLNYQEIDFFNKIKKSIADLYCKLLVFFKSGYNPAKMAFIAPFRVEIGPIIISSLLDSIQLCKNSSVLQYLLHSLFVYLDQFNSRKMEFRPFLEMILNERFLVNILLPASFLPVDDLQNFVDLPEQYLEFCLIFAEEDAYNLTVNMGTTVRQIIFLIVKNFPNEFIEFFFGFLCSPSSGPIEAEAKVFLKTALILSHKDLPLIDLTGQIINEIKQQGNNMPPFYLASLMALLLACDPNDKWTNYTEGNSGENTNLKDCVEFASFSLSNSTYKVIQVLSIKILNKYIDECYTDIVKSNPGCPLASLIPLPEITGVLFKLSTEVHHKSIGEILEKLLYIFPEFFMPSALEFINNIFQLWTTFQSDNDDSSSLLVCISRVITMLPSNCEALYELATGMTPAILSILHDDQGECNGHEQLIDIIGCVSDSLNAPPPEFIINILTMISTPEQKNSNDDDCDNEEESTNDHPVLNCNVISYIRQYSVVICSLICRKNFFETENAVSIVVNIIEFLFCEMDLNRLNASGLVITACLIQAANVVSRALLESSSQSFDVSPFVSLASRAISFLKNYQKYQVGFKVDSNPGFWFEDDDINEKRICHIELNILAVVVVSSSIITNESMVVQMLDIEAINNWIIYHKLLHLVPSKIEFVHWSAIALLNLSKYNIFEKGPLLFQAAINHFLFINDINDDYDDDFEEKDIFNFNISYFPFNNLKCDSEFKSLEKNDQRFQFLSPDQLNSFAQCIGYLSSDE